MATGNKKALEATKAKATSVSTLELKRGTKSEAQSPRVSPQQTPKWSLTMSFQQTSNKLRPLFTSQGLRIWISS